MFVRRWRRLVEGYRWLWSAQARWASGYRWLLPFKFVALVAVDLGDALRAFLRKGRMIPIGVSGPLTVGAMVRRGALLAGALSLVFLMTRPTAPTSETRVVVEAPAPLAPPASPGPRQVQAPSSPQTMTVDITVGPYEVDPSSSLVTLPPSTYLWVLPKYSGGWEIEGDDRLMITLSDSTYHRGGAGGFWPLIVRTPLDQAVDLHTSLLRVIAGKGDDWGTRTGMESLLSLGMYSLDYSQNWHVRLISDAVWQVLPGRPGAPWEAGAAADRRLHLVLWDSNTASWPMVARLDEASARKFADDLDDMIRQKTSQA